jgi:hypothetical protein
MFQSCLVILVAFLLAGQMVVYRRAFFASPISTFTMFALLYLGVGGLLTQYVLDFVLANPLPQRILDQYSYYWCGTLAMLMLLSQMRLRTAGDTGFSGFEVRISPPGRLIIRCWAVLMLVVGAYLAHATAGSNGFEDRLGGYAAYEGAAAVVPIETIFAIGLVFSYLRYLETERLTAFIPPFFIALPILYTGSRNFLFQMFFVLIALSLSKPGRGRQVSFFVIVLLSLAFSWAFLTLGDGSEIDAALVFYRLFAELGHTTVAGLYSFQYAIHADNYNSVLHYAPVVNKFIHLLGAAGNEPYFAKYINDAFIQYHFDMSANFLAEGFYYAGPFGVLVHLTAVGLILFAVSRGQNGGLFTNLLAFLFIAYARNMVRGSFMDIASSVAVYAIFGTIFAMLFCRVNRRRLVTTAPPEAAGNVALGPL